MSEKTIGVFDSGVGGLSVLRAIRHVLPEVKLLYLADQDTDEVDEVYCVPIAGGTAIKLNDPPVSGGGVIGYAFNPDSQSVLYYGNTLTGDINELFYVPVTGGTVTQVNAPLVAGGDVQSYKFSPDGRYIVYLADQETDGLMELYSRSVQDWSITKLSQMSAPMPVLAESVEMTYYINPNSQGVVYIATSTLAGTNLYRVPINGTGDQRTRLNGPKVTGGNVGSFLILPDSNHVVYIGDLETDEKYELYVAFDEYNVYLPLTMR